MVPPVKQTRSRWEQTAALLPKDYIALEKAREQKERFFDVEYEDFDRSVRPFYHDTRALMELRNRQFLTDKKREESEADVSEGPA